MKKSLFVTVPTLALLLCGIVACGGDDKKSSTPVEPSTPTTSTGGQASTPVQPSTPTTSTGGQASTPVQPSTPTTSTGGSVSGKDINIRVGVDSDSWVAELNKYFTDNPIQGIKVTVVNEGASGAADKITETHDAMPDVQLVVDGEVTRNGASLADVGEDLEASLAKNSVAKFVNATKVNGRSKYVPVGYDGMAFAYNKTMLEALGVDVSEITEKGLPESLDTFEEIFELAQLWAEEGYGTYAGKEITTAVSLVAGNSWSGYAYASAGGWKILADEENPTDAGFGSEEFKAGLEFIAAAADAKVKVQKAGTVYELAPSSTLSQEQADDLLHNRTSPMALVGTWMDVAGSTAVQEGDEIVFAAMPTWNGNQPGPFIKSKGFVINAYSKNVAAATVVLEKLYSEELMQIMLNNTSMPAVLGNDTEFELTLSEVQSSMINAFQYGYSEVNRAMPNNPNSKVMDAYYGIGPENFYKQVWDEAAANTGADRDAWLDGIIEDIVDAFDTKVAELNVAPAA